MAADQVFAPRYANAFAAVAAERGLDTGAAQGQMWRFLELLEESRELREVLTDPSIAGEQKLGVLDALAERMELSREVRNFLAVIMDHQRLGELRAILLAYAQVADAGQGLQDALVTSAFALNEDDRRLLEQKVAGLAGSRVRVTFRQDAALMGGAIVTIGSTVYDGSLRGQLEQMKQALVTA